MRYNAGKSPRTKWAVWTIESQCYNLNVDCDLMDELYNKLVIILWSIREGGTNSTFGTLSTFIFSVASHFWSETSELLWTLSNL